MSVKRDMLCFGENLTNNSTRNRSILEHMQTPLRIAGWFPLRMDVSRTQGGTALDLVQVTIRVYKRRQRNLKWHTWSLLHFFHCLVFVNDMQHFEMWLSLYRQTGLKYSRYRLLWTLNGTIPYGVTKRLLCIMWHSTQTLANIIRYHTTHTALQAGRSRARFLIGSLQVFTDFIHVAALWRWGQLSLYQKWEPGFAPGGKDNRCVRPITLPHSGADFLRIPKSSTSWSTKGLPRPVIEHVCVYLYHRTHPNTYTWLPLRP
jgi:hypothetical protein